MVTLASAPPRSLEQRLDALAEANRVRLGAAALKRELAAGAVTIAEALDDERAQAAPIYYLLTGMRWWGPIRVRKLLAAAQISERRRVGALTARQRRELARRIAS